MRKKVYETTVDVFINEMENGYGFWNPGIVMSIGRSLRQIFEQYPDLLSLTVTVEYESKYCSYDNYPFGYKSYYLYKWVIRFPTKLPLINVKGVTESQKLFGYSSPIRIRTDENELYITYTH